MDFFDKKVGQSKLCWTFPARQPCQRFCFSLFTHRHLGMALHTEGLLHLKRHAHALKSISKGYVFLVLYLMEFAKFQIKMARIKRHDLQRFCIFTWHLKGFWAHTFFPGRFFSRHVIFFVAGNSLRVTRLRIAAFLAQPSSPRPSPRAASFGPHSS